MLIQTLIIILALFMPKFFTVVIKNLLFVSWTQSCELPSSTLPPYPKLLLTVAS